MYKEIAEVIGIEKTLLLHHNFQRQQVSFPKKLYTKEYVIQQAKKGTDLKILAFKFDYTKRYLHRMIKENKDWTG